MKKASLLVYCLLIIGFSLKAQATDHTLEVAGKATVKELPQEIDFRIPLKILDVTYLGCSNRLAETLNDLKKDLSKNGIQEAWIKTNNYRISENMVYKDGQHRPIDRYVHPDEFDRYHDHGEALGLSHVESGPLVRSSYHARDSLASTK